MTQVKRPCKNIYTQNVVYSKPNPLLLEECLHENSLVHIILVAVLDLESAVFVGYQLMPIVNYWFSTGAGFLVQIGDL